MKLSESLSTAVVAFLIHDSSLLAYWLFQAGRCTDRFNSKPGYFQRGKETPPAGGDVELILPYCEAGVSRETVIHLLQVEARTEIFAEETVKKLAGCLAIPPGCVCDSYRYIKNGEATTESFLYLDADGEREIHVDV
jgi:hypothetical protein